MAGKHDQLGYDQQGDTLKHPLLPEKMAVGLEQFGQLLEKFIVLRDSSHRKCLALFVFWMKLTLNECTSFFKKSQTTGAGLPDRAPLFRQTVQGCLQ
jgi:hypothetical protein